MQPRDSNSQPSDYESPPPTTRLGLPPKLLFHRCPIFIFHASRRNLTFGTRRKSFSHFITICQIAPKLEEKGCNSGSGCG